MKPTLDIVIPNYNYGHWLPTACESIRIAQELTPEIEFRRIVIVDDASDDKGAAADRCAREYGFRIIKHIDNKGLIFGLNEAISTFTSEFVSVVSADDAIHPLLYKRSIPELIQNPKVGFVYTWFMQFGEAWVPTSVEAFEDWIPNLDVYNMALAQSPFRRRCWEETGGYQVEPDGHEDWHFWERIIKAGWEGKMIPEILYWYRRHRRAVSKLSPKDKANLNYQILVQRGAV